jgi:hypothetical protein
MPNSLTFHLTELLYLGRGLRAYGRRRTPDVRKRFAWLLRLQQWDRYARRRSLADAMPLNPAVRIPEDAGYARLTAFPVQLVREVLDSANRHWSRFDLQKQLANRGERAFVAQFLEPALSPADPVLRLALQPDLLAAVSRYIGMVPVIEGIAIWYSPNDRQLDDSSQFFHLDGQDVRTIQLFVFLEQVRQDNGPLVIVRADASEALARGVSYRKIPASKRLKDEDVMRAVSAQRDVVGMSPRRVLVIQYYSPFAFVLPRRWDRALPLARLAAQPGFNEVERLVLGRR